MYLSAVMWSAKFCGSFISFSKIKFYLFNSLKMANHEKVVQNIAINRTLPERMFNTKQQDCKGLIDFLCTSIVVCAKAAKAPLQRQSVPANTLSLHMNTGSVSRTGHTAKPVTSNHLGCQKNVVFGCWRPLVTCLYFTEM